LTEDCGVIHSCPGNSSSSSSPLLLSILHLRAITEPQYRVDSGKGRSLGVRRERTECGREEGKGGDGEGALGVERSAVTGNPPAATGGLQGLPCRAFSALACPALRLGGKLLPVDDSASLISLSATLFVFPLEILVIFHPNRPRQSIAIYFRLNIREISINLKLKICSVQNYRTDIDIKYD
jgi:hypothetical protein